MRRGFLIMAAVCLAAFIAALLWSTHQSGRVTGGETPAQGAAEIDSGAVSVVAASPPYDDTPRQEPATNSLATAAAVQTQQQRIDELQELMYNDDADSLATILSELTNPSREVRAAALEAAIQFGSRSAVPRLRELADLATDPVEKGELLAAAEFLELPSLTEFLAKKGKQIQPSAPAAPRNLRVAGSSARPSGGAAATKPGAPRRAPPQQSAE